MKQKQYISIKQLSSDDQPREKLLLKGRSVLSNAEILAILIGSGTRSKSAVALCQEILQSVDNDINQLAKLSIHDLMKFKGLLLDVRTAEEFNEGHIEGAVNIDFYGDTFENSLDSLDPQTTVLVYCQAGGRSGQAMEMLNNKGFSEVYNLVGGYGNWPFK